VVNDTGRQKDGTYIPCPQCNWTPPIERNPGPGYPVLSTGITHYSDCPTIPTFTPQERRELVERLAEMDRVRRRGAAEAMNFWIG